MGVIGLPKGEGLELGSSSISASYVTTTAWRAARPREPEAPSGILPMTGSDSARARHRGASALIRC